MIQDAAESFQSMADAMDRFDQAVRDILPGFRKFMASLNRLVLRWHKRSARTQPKQKRPLIHYRKKRSGKMFVNKIGN